MKKEETVGIKEIARLAGVSIGTVDRVLHNRMGVSIATREKVMRIIRDTGYKKNIVASRLKLAARKKINIAILFPEIRNDWSYWKLPQEGINKAVEELIELGISVSYFHFDLSHPPSFNVEARQIVHEDFDGIITVPFLEAESYELLEQTHKKNIPVVFLDTERPLDQTANFIRQNSFNAGMVAGRLLYGLVGDGGFYFVVNILNKRGIQINNQQRDSGFRAFFSQNFKNRSFSIHTINHPLDDQLALAPEVQDLFRHPQAKGIFVTNARSFLLPELLKENNINNTHIVGFDLNRRNLAYLKSGDIDFLINQKPEYQGYSAVKGLYKYLTQEDKSELNIDIPVEIIVKENAGI